MDIVIALVALVLGVALGTAVGWFAARSHTGSAAQQVAAAEATARASQHTAQELVAAEREAARREVLAAQQSAAAQVAAAQAAAQQQIAAMQADRERLAEQFEALSHQVLKATTESFLEVADQRFQRTGQATAAELAKREGAIREMVGPMTATLQAVHAEVSAAEKARAEAQAALAVQLSEIRDSSAGLRDETKRLVTALRAPQVRGRWGEMQLRRLVESAGLLNHVDFDEQVQVAGGKLRPDMVVHLPGNKQIVVDSKVPLDAFLDASDARDEAERTASLSQHARQVRNHVKELHAKEYWEQFPASPEFVVMFIPAESFWSVALQQDPNLMEDAFAQNVVVATPATMLALLRTVSYTWRQERLAERAEQILALARELHKRFGTVGGHLTKLAKNLNSTVESFNAFNSSFDRNVVTQARRLADLQQLDPFDAPPPLEIQAVPASKGDLYQEPEQSETALTQGS